MAVCQFNIKYICKRFSWLFPWKISLNFVMFTLLLFSLLIVFFILLFSPSFNTNSVENSNDMDHSESLVAVSCKISINEFFFYAPQFLFNSVTSVTPLYDTGNLGKEQELRK